MYQIEVKNASRKTEIKIISEDLYVRFLDYIAAAYVLLGSTYPVCYNIAIAIGTAMVSILIESIPLRCFFHGSCVSWGRIVVCIDL